MLETLEGGHLLRNIVISGIAGFMMFCVSYGISVWLKRNRATRKTRTALGHLGSICLLVGAIGATVPWILNEYTSRNGVVDGADLFVVHAKRDAVIERLAPEGQIDEGAVIAELRPPAIEGTLAVLDNQIKEAQARIAALQARALPIDQVLGQKQAQIRARIDQHKNFLYDLLKAAREFERDYLALQTRWVQDKGALESDLSTSRKALETNAQLLTVAKAQADRAADLKSRGLLSNAVTVEDREAQRLTLIAERARNLNQIEESGKRIAKIDARYRISSEAFERQIALIATEMRKADQTVGVLQMEIADVEKAIGEDRNRAKEYTAREIEAALHQLHALFAEKQKNLSIMQIKSPFKGRVVYRHSSPGLAGDNVPVLAISSGTGFNARVWMPPEEIDEIAQAGDVLFQLDNVILRKFFLGQFRKAEEAPFESRRIAHFDARLPIEAISELSTRNEPLRIRLAWRPNILQSLLFRTALAVALLGLALIAISGLTVRTLAQRDARLTTPMPALAEQIRGGARRQATETLLRCLIMCVGLCGGLLITGGAL
ncbi:HlyD family secretion protein [Methylobacterium sp. DM1]|nr:HlyD family secretion protein [Methylobacterium sp. DM1]